MTVAMQDVSASHLSVILESLKLALVDASSIYNHLLPADSIAVVQSKSDRKIINLFGVINTFVMIVVPMIICSRKSQSNA